MGKITVLQINTVYKKGSTGKIIAGIETVCHERDIVTYVAYRYPEDESESQNSIPVSNWLDCHIHNRIAKYTGMQGVFSYLKTKKFLKIIDAIHPAVIHIHNIHGNFVNYKLLFAYIKKHNIRTIWTLHDCWSFTGLCPHFLIYECDKWRNGCGSCPLSREQKYPLFDFTGWLWKRKKASFSGVEQMVLVTPSQWLSGLVKESFMSQYPVRVINNGIDLKLFQPRNSNIRDKFGCRDQFIILGVAFDWGRRKGLDVFIELAERLANENIKIILVGTTEAIDAQLPKNIISIHRTENQKELAEIYSAADLFVNPTREDNFPTVNIESLACGTPVLTFKTGGSPEMLNEKCGAVVPCDDLEQLVNKIRWIKAEKPFNREDCVKRAQQYDMNDKFKEYVELYEDSPYFRKCTLQ